jgi:hypothetical protein
MSKPVLSTFVYAESIQKGQDGKPQVVAPMHIFVPQFIPSMFSFSVFLGILGVDTKIEHEFRFKFKDPQGTVVYDSGNMKIFNPNAESEDLPIDMRGFVASLDFRNIPLRHEGKYVSQVFIDGECIGEVPIKVKGREKS